MPAQVLRPCAFDHAVKIPGSSFTWCNMYTSGRRTLLPNGLLEVASVRAANRLAIRSLLLGLVARAVGAAVLIEQPAHSWWSSMERIDFFQMCIRMFPFYKIALNQQLRGACSRKLTWLFSNHNLKHGCRMSRWRLLVLLERQNQRP